MALELGLWSVAFTHHAFAYGGSHDAIMHDNFALAWG